VEVIMMVNIQENSPLFGGGNNDGKYSRKQPLVWWR
jgi:hypothetical protein